VMDSDVILLVTEPTPFGFYDFKLAWEAFSPLDKPMAAVINRAGLGEKSVYAFCREKGLPILAEIPYDRALAEAYSRGELASGVSAGLKKTFQDLARQVRALAAQGNAPARKAVHA